jgi:2,5-furandicarboxylate decarboxylase 1
MAKMGIDATIPENVSASRFNRIVYVNQGKVDLRNYLGEVGEPARRTVGARPSETVETISEKILAALEESHRFCADLLEMFSRVDYRTIAAALGQLHQDGRITQDGDGKYQVKKPES